MQNVRNILNIFFIIFYESIGGFRLSSCRPHNLKGSYYHHVGPTMGDCLRIIFHQQEYILQSRLFMITFDLTIFATSIDKHFVCRKWIFFAYVTRLILFIYLFNFITCLCLYLFVLIFTCDVQIRSEKSANMRQLSTKKSTHLVAKFYTPQPQKGIVMLISTRIASHYFFIQVMGFELMIQTVHLHY